MTGFRRRGLVWKFAIILVIALAILLVLLPFFGRFFVQLSGQTPEEICRSSVFANAILRLDKTQFSENIRCKEEFITIATTRPAKAMPIVADAMATCWAQFLEGKRQLFGNDGTYCHICSLIDFKDKTTTIAGFKEFLFKTNVPRKDVRYTTYLTPFLSTKDVTNYVKTGPAAVNAWNGDVLDTSKEYAVVFVYSKGRDQIELLLKDLAIVSTIGWLQSELFHAATGIDVRDLLPGAGTVWFASPLLTEFTPQNLQGLGCRTLVRARNE